jgi:hypothetical protein
MKDLGDLRNREPAPSPSRQSRLRAWPDLSNRNDAEEELVPIQEELVSVHIVVNNVN